MSGQNQHLCNLYMLWCIGGVNGNIGNIVASEGLDAFVHIGRTVVVTMEADVAEVGLHQAWLQIRDIRSWGRF